MVRETPSWARYACSTRYPKTVQMAVKAPVLAPNHARILGKSHAGPDNNGLLPPDSTGALVAEAIVTRQDERRPVERGLAGAAKLVGRRMQSFGKRRATGEAVVKRGHELHGRDLIHLP